MNRNKLG